MCKRCEDVQRETGYVQMCDDVRRKTERCVGVKKEGGVYISITRATLITDRKEEEETMKRGREKKRK